MKTIDWVRTTCKLPPPCIEVLILHKDGRMRVSYTDGCGDWWQLGVKYRMHPNNVTHWAHLPDRPAPEEG